MAIFLTIDIITYLDETYPQYLLGFKDEQLNKEAINLEKNYAEIITRPIRALFDTFGKRI